MAGACAPGRPAGADAGRVLRVIAREAAGGLVVTASHNPARFNGIKLKGAFGGSADPEFTGRVEAALGGPRRGGAGRRRRPRRDRRPSCPTTSTRLRSRVARRPPAGERLPASSPTPSTARPTGSCRALVPAARGARCESCTAAPDPLFGGLHPEPIPPHLDQLAAEVRASGADLGSPMDGTATGSAP